MRHVICGLGEVGRALNCYLLEKHCSVGAVDPHLNMRCNAKPHPVLLHICFPYSEEFGREVRRYRDIYIPDLVVIHSTVPVGTTRRLGIEAVHAPTHGVHPNLKDALTIFPKMLGGTNSGKVSLVKQYLTDLGISCVVTDSPETSEMLKIMCTTQYAWNILLCKEIKAECDKYNVNFHQAYFLWNQYYNQGYQTLGRSNVTRPILEPTPGEIGGHCLIPNAKLHPCWLTDTILNRNEYYKKETQMSNVKTLNYQANALGDRIRKVLDVVGLFGSIDPSQMQELFQAISSLRSAETLEQEVLEGLKIVRVVTHITPSESDDQIADFLDRYITEDVVKLVAYFIGLLRTDKEEYTISSVGFNTKGLPVSLLLEIAKQILPLILSWALSRENKSA